VNVEDVDVEAELQQQPCEGPSLPTNAVHRQAGVILRQIDDLGREAQEEMAA
jgi:hypothetical protein